MIGMFDANGDGAINLQEFQVLLIHFSGFLLSFYVFCTCCIGVFFSKFLYMKQNYVGCIEIEEIYCKNSDYSKPTRLQFFFLQLINWSIPRLIQLSRL
ncbi:hypothetical protein OESDEN_19639 [Oesophagostomum dentatum]|uniref:EF-hand domain-containing protein n=1 Tax=Oesophagostomum dentatum TaxID=61180 RepID=A0A0B1SAY8_OESDE|nr:hypothetical protein OESDEN_19639 [Oesophagostomum dentatum]